MVTALKTRKNNPGICGGKMGERAEVYALPMAAKMADSNLVRVVAIEYVD